MIAKVRNSFRALEDKNVSQKVTKRWGYKKLEKKDEKYINLIQYIQNSNSRCSRKRKWGGGVSSKK